MSSLHPTGELRHAVEGTTSMKLACASSSLHRDIERGELTQLEFFDLCARELACDGVVLDVRHFPRTDDDYLAQVKKMAADRGLTIAALTRRRVLRLRRPRGWTKSSTWPSRSAHRSLPRRSRARSTPPGASSSAG